MTDLTFTDEDIAVGPVLGPEYRASQRFAEGVMKGFQDEHLQPLMKIIADEVQDRLWDVARDWLLQDTETNVHGAVRSMVEVVGGAIIVAIILAELLYRPIVCAICGGGMVRTGPNKLWCPDCGRNGHG